MTALVVIDQELGGPPVASERFLSTVSARKEKATRTATVPSR
jgi:hypothetical protein